MSVVPKSRAGGEHVVPTSRAGAVRAWFGGLTVSRAACCGAALALAAALGGCRSGRSPASDQAAPPEVSSAPAPAPSASAAVLTRLDMNLLGLAGVNVRVSSEVGTASDLPSHLIDGDLATAWQTRSGELEGAWFEVDLPSGVRVRRLSLAPGFVKKGKGHDLFRENYRVAEVAIFRDGQLVKTASFDTDLPALQAVELDEPGGTFRVEIRRLVAGTVKSYREVCVSELAITGDAGDVPPAIGAPAVRVGPRETVSRLLHAGEAVKRFEDICREDHPSRYGCKLEAIEGFDLAPSPPVLEVAPFLWGGGIIEQRVAVRTAKGWFELPIDFGRTPACEGTYLSSRVLEARVVGGLLVVRLRSGQGEQGNHVGPNEPMISLIEQTHVCSFSGRDMYCGAFRVGDADDSTLRDPLKDAKWRRDKVVRVDASGRLSIDVNL